MDLKIKERWIDLVGTYFEEGATSLYVDAFKLTTEDWKQLIGYLSGSQVEKLKIMAETSDQEWEPFFEAVRSSKIQELVLYNCYKTKEEYLHLMNLIKKTKITSCGSLGNCVCVAPFNLDELNKFISCLVDSHLENFNIYVKLNGLHSVLFEALPQTRFTQFDLRHVEQWLTPVAFSSLCHNLEFTQLTDLCLIASGLNINHIKLLCPVLKNSRLKKLVLDGNKIDDDCVNILVESLVYSKINYLDLSHNKINGANVLGIHLKDTQIKTLLLSYNNFEQSEFFLIPLKLSSVNTLKLVSCNVSGANFKSVMKSLKFSKVTELDLSRNIYGLNAKIGNIFKDTHLERVNFSGYGFDQEALMCLAGSMKESKLNHIGLAGCFKFHSSQIELSSFLSEICVSSVSSLDLSDNYLHEADVDILASHLANSKITRFDLSRNEIGDGVRSLAKVTQLFYLSLSYCNINDKDVENLAFMLKNTQLGELNLDSNEFTSLGAKNLAPYLKESCLLRLELRGREIESDGVEVLAQGAEGTFITTLSVFRTESSSLLDLVLWRNKIAKQRLLNLFKLISPKLGGNSFCFVHPDGMDATVYLEHCLELCVTVTQKPLAVSVLLKNEKIQLLKEEIISLISDEFPSQLVLFVASRVEVNAEANIRLLKKAQELGFSKIVELFLLHRPLFTIDVTEGILHPYFYKLLHENNHLICNLEIEPEGEQKILRYFTKHRDVIEDAVDIIMLLRRKQKQ